MSSFGAFVLIFGLTISFMAAGVTAYASWMQRKNREKSLDALKNSTLGSDRSKIIGDLTVRDYISDSELASHIDQYFADVKSRRDETSSETESNSQRDHREPLNERTASESEAEIGTAEEAARTAERQARRRLGEERRAERRETGSLEGRKRAKAGILVRRNVYSLSRNGAEIAALREGVRKMKRRSPSDPTSWIYQANIYSTFDAPPNQQAARLWNQGQHGSFFFLSWNRMYLYFFERILRVASGDPNLALPYWNYFNPGQRALPVEFRQPADASNPLYVKQRDPSVNGGAPLPAAAVSHLQAFTFVNFSSAPNSGLSFGGPRVSHPVHFSPTFGQLENVPHNLVHSLLGGPSGFMNNPNLAARDPIFLLHHSNIDRLWKRWLDQGGGRQNPVDDDVWMDTPFAFFDENGQEVVITGRDILDTIGQLDYRYDDDPPNVPRVTSVAEAEIAAALQAANETISTPLGESEREHMIELGATPTIVPIKLREEATDQVADLAQGEGVENRIVLNIEGIQYDEKSGVFYELYINLPEDQEPDFHSEYFIGLLGFPSEPTGKIDYDITANVRLLAQREEWGRGQVLVTFIPRRMLEAETDAEAEAAAVTTQVEPSAHLRIERATLVTVVTPV
jgi:hypothetical protein